MSPPSCLPPGILDPYDLSPDSSGDAKRRTVITTARQLGATLLIAVSVLTTQEAAGHDAVVMPLLIKELAEVPGKEILMLTVEYAAGDVEAGHRHDAHGFIYVLEGSIEMGLKGGKVVTLHAGETFCEGLDDVHSIGRNASKVWPAKLLVLLVKNKGVDAVLPAR